MNHQYLIIGDARTDVLKRVTSWCHVVQDGDARRQSTAGAAIATASNIDINRFFNHESYDDASAFISSFQSYWEQLEANTPASSYSADGPLKKQKQRQHNSDHQKCLLPGDWILSINGYPPARFGGTLEHVCQYLRQVNDFTIVVARSNIALANSMQVLSSSNAAVMNRDVISLESARAAFNIWRKHNKNANSNSNVNIQKILRFQTTHQALPSTPQKAAAIPQQQQQQQVMSTMTPGNGPISRLVTPDHPTIASHHRQQPQHQALQQRRLLFPSTPVPVVSSTNPFHYYHTQKLLQEQLKAREEFELLNHVASVNARSLVLSTLAAHQHHDERQQQKQQQQRQQQDEHVELKRGATGSASNTSTSRKLKATQQDSISTLPVVRIDVDFQEWLKCRKQQWKEFRRLHHRSSGTVGIDVDFHKWLNNRKQQWKKLPRHRYRGDDRETGQNGGPVSLVSHSLGFSTGGNSCSYRSTVSSNATKTTKSKPPILPADWRNPLFKDPNTGLGLPYCDNWEFTPEEGSRAELFIQPVNDFPDWLKKRKEKWRRHYKVHKFESDKTNYSDNEDEDCLYHVSGDTLVPHDFWRTSQGYASFDDWLQDSVIKWKKAYSWNQRKRKKIQQECEEIVHLPHTIATQAQNEEFCHWLRIRKFQWRIARRKRQRHRLELEEEVQKLNEEYAETAAGAESMLSDGTDDILKTGAFSSDPNADDMATVGGVACASGARPTKRSKHSLVLSGALSRDFAVIDDMLDHEETQRKEKVERPPLDIELLFDPDDGVPDDVLVQCFAFLHPVEHYKLLFINKTSSKSLRERGEQLWRQVSWRGAIVHTEP